MHLIALSALQHYAFCPRQCALIHNEQQWSENFLTAQGNVLHERVDAALPETRQGVRYERSVHLSSEKLGIVGLADVVEIYLNSGEIRSVEYKRGREKLTNIDKVQLCAQALCLEEMLNTCIREGVLWYGQTRKREIIVLDDALRKETLDIIAKVRELLNSGETQQAKYDKSCKACSLIDICQPSQLSKDHSGRYISEIFQRENNEEITE